MNTIEYLDAVRARHGLTSDYQLHKLIGCTQQAVSKWRNGKATIGDEFAQRFAELLDIDPAKVVADLHAERERDETMKALWRRMAAAFACTAALGFGAAYHVPQASATTGLSEYKFTTRRLDKNATCYA